MRWSFIQAYLAIFVHNIMRLDENKEKSLSSIEWGQYPISTGETIELCAGIVEKKGLSYIEHGKSNKNYK